MNKIFVLLLISLSFLSFSHAAQEDEKIQAKAIMDGIYGSFLKVIPYVYSDEDTVDSLKKNKARKKELLENLNDISLFFKNARHVDYFQKPGFRPSLESMNSHLDDTINAVKSNNFAFAQKRMNALTTLCVSCHSQLSTDGAKNAFGSALTAAGRESFGSDYAYGNYLFLVRRFDDSEKYLTMAIERALQESRTSELYASYRRIISIHTKISFNHVKAKSFVDKQLTYPKLPVLGKTMLLAWKNSLIPWASFEPSKLESIDQFIKTYLSPLEEVKEQTGTGDNDITLLIASGILSKYLNDYPQASNTAEILYWLSIAERRLSSTYFFTLSDLYLKDCVKLYPKTSFAKKCYGLYEENINFGYSGSAGTDIPPEEKKELVKLRSYLK